MAKILIPRSDSISAKVIAPSDFEAFFSNDIVNNYVKSGFTLSAGTGLSVNIATGLARLKGLFINNSTASSKGSLTASNTNYIYVTLSRDSFSEAESWSFTSNTTGTTPTDSLFIGTATTDGSSVTAVDMIDVENFSGGIKVWGDGSDGAKTFTNGETVSDINFYTTVDIPNGVTITPSESSETGVIIYATESITVNGTINVTGYGGNGGANTLSGGAGGTGITSQNRGKPGSAGDAVTIASNAGFIAGGLAGGGGGSGGWGGRNPALGGQGGSGGAGIAGKPYIRTNYQMYFLYLANHVVYGSGGNSGAAGGGGGSGGNSGAAGGAGGVAVPGVSCDGGNGGGFITLVAPTITIGSTASLLANGDAGTAGATGSTGNNGTGAGGGGGGSGGGSGGNGGLITLIYETKTENGSATITVNGGTGGTGGTGGLAGVGGGTPGDAGAAGATGSTGIVGKIQRLSG
jgi:hypothetical protein